MNIMQFQLPRAVHLCLALPILLIAAAKVTQSSAGNVASFEGTVEQGVAGDLSNEKAFLKFIEANDHRIIFLGILHNDEQAGAMRAPSEEEGGRKRKYFAIPEDWKVPHLGGIQIAVLISPGDDFVLEPTQSPWLAGQFKIIGGAGPHTGYFVHILKPVNIEDMPR